ncbi:myotubularin-related protein 10-B-like isoform X2 [Octopus sinensis]|uniref:Myotubularin-related protein 10-B-like isoform X2 n=1 Tax=Octopus sinensis TaxID=2607531 RepID=A0A7E6FDK5_9MOLL|nr:myotubularin-related protein 10-B-like isoform X2 [Octopus sinensis]
MAKQTPFLGNFHPKSSFTSFINGNDKPPNNEHGEMQLNPNTNLQPKLLSGEKLIFSIEKVLKFNSFMNYKQGVSGALHLTNYKLAFVTSSELDDGPENFFESAINSTNEIPFTNIDCIYQVFSQAKKKKLLAVNSIQQPCKRLMIYSRDFKIHSYGFKMVGNNEKIIQFLKQMSQYAFPDKNNLFVLNYNLKVKADEFSAEPPMPMFIRQKDWQDELTRIDQHPNWYVTSANENFQLSSSLPEYFIIPESLNNESLTEMAMAFDDQRLLSWSYSSSFGTTLARMSCLKTGMNTLIEKETFLINAVKKSTNTAVSVLDLIECCPSVKDIGLSGEKLKELCMTGKLCF